MNAQILVSNIGIRQVSGLFCLNDLHKAAGGENKHRPQYWLENQQTQDLIAVLQADGIPSAKENQRVIHVMNGIGTFVCEELVYSYASWVSAKFHLLVLRTFRDVVHNSLNAIPQTFSEALRLAADLADEKAALLAEKEANAPKVAFADAVGNANDTILIRDLAKVLKQNGMDMGEKRLFAYLRENGFLTLQNMPTQRAMDLGLFWVKESVIALPDGDRISFTTRVTGKGQQYFLKRFSKGRQHEQAMVN